MQRGSNIDLHPEVTKTGKFAATQSQESLIADPEMKKTARTAWISFPNKRTIVT